MAAKRSAANPVYAIIAVRTLQASALGVAAHWLLRWPFTGPHALGLFLTPALCLYFVFVFVGPLRWGLPILTHLPKSENALENALALTFDDGPSAETTPLVLESLRAAGVRATFFVLGEAVTRRSDLMRRIVSEGHSVGIHAFHHAPFVLMNAEAIISEIRQTEAAIRSACPDAKIVPWVRPPHGFKTLSLVWTLRRAGYGCASWSVNSRDYRDDHPERIAARVLNGSRAGAIVLLHDGPENAATAAALLPALHGLKERGLMPVPLAGEPSRRND